MICTQRKTDGDEVSTKTDVEVILLIDDEFVRLLNLPHELLDAQPRQGSSSSPS
jgi:hypothetical protein